MYNSYLLQWELCPCNWQKVILEIIPLCHQLNEGMWMYRWAPLAWSESYSSTTKIRRLLENTAFGGPEFLGSFSSVGTSVPDQTQVAGKILMKLDELMNWFLCSLSHSIPTVSLALNLSSASQLSNNAGLSLWFSFSRTSPDAVKNRMFLLNVTWQ